VSVELEATEAGTVVLHATFDQAKLPKQQAQLLLEQLDCLLYQNSTANHASVAMGTSLISILPARCPELKSPVSLLHQFVELSARRTPSSVALEFVTEISGSVAQSRKWTYKQLDEEGNAVASLLQTRGVRPQSLVAICFEKCPEASFAILGILKAGCAYVALDPKAPASRKRYIIQDSQTSIILSTTSLAPEFEFLQVSRKDKAVAILFLDEQQESTEQFQPVAISDSDLSYCLYTSGTTGNPKGCEITHENAVQAMRSFSILFKNRWDSESKWLQFASFHFDVSVLEQFWTWSVGISMVSASRDLMLEDLPGFIRALSITHLDLTPSLATLLHPDDVPSLCRGVFITGGEALRQDILDIWGPHEVVHNGYGPTETTIGVTMFTRVPHNGRPSNIGHQFENVGSYVLEAGSETPVLRGGIGELCISGKLVGRGYLNNGALTAAKFPTLKKYGERVYRTGDLVRMMYDGSFEFLGRADDQIKLRGQRLEIGEVNSVIRGNELVEALATYVLKHPKQQKQHLVSFVVFTASGTTQNQSLQIDLDHFPNVTLTLDRCRQQLPPYMVPTYLIPINILPLTPNNKIDQARLQRLYESMTSEDIQNIATLATDVKVELSAGEEAIARVLSDSFKIDIGTIRPTSSIFELGLDSISTIRFSRMLKVAGFTGASPSLVVQGKVDSKHVVNAIRANP
jgi:amino acid adenylation domain-containing protein